MDSTRDREKTPFEKQRDVLVAEVAEGLENVIMSMNQLNRNLESVISVGKEFENVSSLWKQFHAVMAASTASATDIEVDQEA